MSRPHINNPRVAHEVTAAIEFLARGDGPAHETALVRLSQEPDDQVVNYLRACLRDSGAEVSLIERDPGPWAEQAVAVLAALRYRTTLEKMRCYWRARGTEVPGSAPYALGPHGFVLKGS